MDSLIPSLTLLIYICPSAIAVARGHPHRGALIALNLFLGWTILGWLGAFIWACGFEIVIDPKWAFRKSSRRR